MQTDNLVTASQAAAVLANFCDRNAAAELRLARPHGDPLFLRVRLLALQPDRLYVDRPDSGAHLLVEGQRLEVFINTGTIRWAFATVVLERRAMLQLNAQQRIPAVVLRVPQEMTNNQRRRDYRVSVASRGIACTVIEASRQFPYACDLDAMRWNAVVANISARGAGLLIHPTGPLGIVAGQQLFMDFCLPEVDGGFHLAGEVRHVRAVQDSNRYVLGIRFLPLPTCQDRALWRTLNQFVVDEQRRKLRRKR
jgi:c-di-GMP-binding flagellar brake protein YcgR